MAFCDNERCFYWDYNTIRVNMYLLKKNSSSNIFSQSITSGAFNCLFAVPAAQFGDPGDVGRRTGTQMTIMAFGKLEAILFL